MQLRPVAKHLYDIELKLSPSALSNLASTLDPGKAPDFRMLLEPTHRFETQER